MLHGLTLTCHLSAIKGGQLAAAARSARIVTLLISDVPDDDPAVMGFTGTGLLAAPTQIQPERRKRQNK